MLTTLKGRGTGSSNSIRERGEQAHCHRRGVLSDPSSQLGTQGVTRGAWVAEEDMGIVLDRVNFALEVQGNMQMAKYIKKVYVTPPTARCCAPKNPRSADSILGQPWGEDGI